MIILWVTLFDSKESFSPRVLSTLKIMKLIRTLPLLFAFSSLVFVAGTTQTKAQSAFDDPGVRRGGSGGGDFVPVTANIDGGEVSLGSSSQVVVLFRNDGAKPVQAGKISLYPSSNISAEISQNECSGLDLVPDAVCAVALTVKGLQPGKYRIEMLLRHNGMFGD